MEITKLNTLKFARVARVALFTAMTLAAGAALAQGSYSGSTNAVCEIVSFLRTLFGAVAVAAIIILAINSIWGKSELIQNVSTGVIVASVLVLGAPTLMQRIGFMTTCANTI
jgi:hypothetical protein